MCTMISTAIGAAATHVPCLVGVDRRGQHDRRGAEIGERGDVRRGLGAAADAGGQAEGGMRPAEGREQPHVVDDQGAHAEIEEPRHRRPEPRLLAGPGDRVERHLELGAVGPRSAGGRLDLRPLELARARRRG